MILSRIPAIFFHGMSGSLRQNSSERCLAGSPIISSDRSTALVVLRSDTNASKDVSATNAPIESISSRMCKTYALSFSIKNSQVTHDGRFHIFTHAAFGHDIDLSVEDVFQTVLQTNQVHTRKRLFVID